MTTPSHTSYSGPRLKEAFFKKGVSSLLEKSKARNVHSVPRLTKIVINIGVSAAKENIKALDIAADELAQISGQKPVIRRAAKSVSAFKIRQGMPIGVSVTLRGMRMYEFLDRFISLAVPRIRDFRGFSPKAFDGHGNYNIGIREQYIFPEVNVEKSDAARGMNISFVTTAASDKGSFELLTVLGIPFAKTSPKLN